MKKVILFIFLTSFLWIGCTSKSGIVLKGDIQNNIIPAETTVAGKIIQMDKNQGEPVKKGEVIAVVDNVNQKYAVDQLQAVVDMKKAKLEEILGGARPETLATAEAQTRAAKAQLDLLISGNRNEQIEQVKNDVAIAQESYAAAELTNKEANKKYKDALILQTEGVISQDELDAVKYQFDTTSHQLETAKYRLENAKQQQSLIQEGATSQAISAARANYDAANAQLTLIKNGATEQTIAIARAELEQSVAQLNQAKNTLESCNIKALTDGIIISKNYQLGDVVSIGNDIVDIAVKDDIYVLCYIPVKYLDKIVYNQELNVITSEGEQKGRVSYIALESEYTPKENQTNEDKKNKSVKIKVAIDDAEGVLKSGMTAEVEISF